MRPDIVKYHYNNQQQGLNLLKEMELDFLEYNDACWYHWVKKEQPEIKAKIIKPSHPFHQVSLAVVFGL